MPVNDVFMSVFVLDKGGRRHREVFFFSFPQSLSWIESRLCAEKVSGNLGSMCVLKIDGVFTSVVNSLVAVIQVYKQ